MGRESAARNGNGRHCGLAASHPLYGCAGPVGRVVTAFDPDGYVLIDGLLVRAVLSAGQATVGDTVDLELDPAGRLLARAAGFQPGR